MTHSVTIRTHTVTTSSSTIFVNIGYIKTWSGLLKLLELAFGIICVGIIGDEFNSYYRYRPIPQTPECFFLVITAAFFIGTLIIFVSCLVPHTADILSKSLYEFFYHFFAFLLLFTASLTLIIDVNISKNHTSRYELLGASMCGFINTALYLASTIIAVRGYESPYSLS